MAMLMKNSGIIACFVLFLSVVVSTKRGKNCFGMYILRMGVLSYLNFSNFSWDIWKDIPQFCFAISFCKKKGDSHVFFL